MCAPSHLYIPYPRSPRNPRLKSSFPFATFASFARHRPVSPSPRTPAGRPPIPMATDSQALPFAPSGTRNTPHATSPAHRPALALSKNPEDTKPVKMVWFASSGVAVSGMRLALCVRPGLIADLSGPGVNPGDSHDCRHQE